MLIKIPQRLAVPVILDRYRTGDGLEAIATSRQTGSWAGRDTDGPRPGSRPGVIRKWVGIHRSPGGTVANDERLIHGEELTIEVQVAEWARSGSHASSLHLTLLA